MKCEDCAAGWDNDGAKGCKGLCVHVSIGMRGGFQSCTLRFGVLECDIGVYLFEKKKTKVTQNHLHIDVNECAKNNGDCDSKRKCTNTAGSRTCGDCPAGWDNDGETGCKGLHTLMD